MELKKEAIRQLHELAHPTKEQQCKDTLKKLTGRYVPVKDDIFWPAGMLLLGLFEQAKMTGDEECLKEVTDYVSDWMKDGAKITFMDDAFAGYVVCKLYEYTGNEVFAKACDAIAEYLLKAPKDEKGSLIYRPGREHNYIFADGAGMSTMFLAKYATVMNATAQDTTHATAQDGAQDAAQTARASQATAAHAQAITEIRNYLQYGLDARSGLAYHGYEITEDHVVKYGLIGWGRAMGWLLMGMTGLLLNMDPSEDSYGEIKQQYEALMEKTKSWQREDGGFSWQLEALEGPMDTSATGMIGYAMASAMQAGLLSKDEPFLTRMTQAIDRFTTDGVVGQALAECAGFAEHRQEYGSYPWGQGAALAFTYRCKEMQQEEK